MGNAFAQRLVNARKIRCLSQRELSNKLEGQVSPTAIEKYEKGLMMPSSSALILLSKALGMKLDYFFRPFTVAIDTSKFEFRKSASIGVKKLESIKFMVCAEIEKYLEIEGILGNTTSFTLDYSNILVEGEDEAKLLARKLREDLNIGYDAIVSAVELLESCGVKIIEIDHDEKFSGTCNTAGTIPVIVINRNMTSERKRITIFHELGHLLMHCAEGVDKEKMCNIFANEVLIPSDKFKNLLGASRHDISLVELQAIQCEYGISVDALMAKAAQLNIITNNRYTSYYKKKNALPAFKEAVDASHYPMEHTNRFERLVYRALASEVISTSKAAAILDVSVNEVRNNLNLM
ncbi:MAG: ImmA/IrrE family metallo-endopeptidase [Bacteroidales bacterium]|nr:ImmA/IrrE family metallo-endopeptidase [Candidatus Colimorpha onthohippi]